jgi:hypothetical protein
MKDWHEIDGWFNDSDAEVYRHMVGSIDSGHILELGAYKGRSTMCLAQMITDSGKDIKIHVVDTFKGDAHIGEADTLKEFTENLCPYKHLLGSVNVGTSVEISEVWGIKLDGVYIDASHDYKSVLEDIDSWYKHLKIGGIMGGHDYNFTTVRRAVQDRFTEVNAVGNSWLVLL